MPHQNAKARTQRQTSGVWGHFHSVTTSLGDILRYSLSFTDEAVAPGEELRHFESYLSIHKHRFGDKLNISMEGPELKLQPILDKNFRHGLPYKEACWDINKSCSIKRPAAPRPSATPRWSRAYPTKRAGSARALHVPCASGRAVRVRVYEL
ncbi:MAG: sensor histidine kinase [Lachnospiraceae bacterium]